MTGVPCPGCGSIRSLVKETRMMATKELRRRRECYDCKRRFSTVETVIPDRYRCTPVQSQD